MADQTARFEVALAHSVAPLPPIKIPLTEVARLTGETLPTLYAAMAAGHLRTFLVGRRRFARVTDVRAWVDFLEKESNAGCPVTYRARDMSRRPEARRAAR